MRTARPGEHLLIEACHGLSDAWLELRGLLYGPTEGVSAFDDEAERRLGPLGTSCAQAVAKVKLVFGRDSPAGEAATLVDRRVARLKDDAIRAKHPWDEAATTKIKSAREAAEGAHERFLEKAHEAIPTRLVGSRRLSRWGRLRQLIAGRAIRPGDDKGSESR